MPIEINGTGSIVGVDSLSTPAVTNAAGSASAPSITFTGDSNTGIYSPAADTIAFTEGGVESVRIDSSGRVGIGTTSPSQALHVVGTVQAVSTSSTAASNVGLRLSNSGDGTLFNGISFQGNYFSDLYFGRSGGADDLVVRNGSSELLRIQNGGRLLVGTSSAVDGALLQVQGGISINGVTNTSPVNTAGHYISPVVNSAGLNTCKSATNDTSGSGDLWQYSRINTDGVIFRFHRGTTSVGTVSITSSATAYNTSSDYRLKENVVPVTDGIARLRQLKPSRFNFIADPDTTVDGFIAHEVQDVVPEVIHGTKDEVDADGNPVYQGIDQSKLVPLLTAALQEAIGEIESLKVRVAALESA